MRRRSKREPNTSESTGKIGHELPSNQPRPLVPNYPEDLPAGRGNAPAKTEARQEPKTAARPHVPRHTPAAPSFSEEDPGTGRLELETQPDYPSLPPEENAAAGRTAQEEEVFGHVQRLLALRVRVPALRQGRFVDLAVTEKTWAYARVDGTETAIVALNNGDGPAEIEVPYGNGVYAGQLGVGGELRVSGGRGVVRLPGHEAEVYLRQP